MGGGGSLLSIDLMGLAGGRTIEGGQGHDQPFSECSTAEAANSSIDCRIAAAADSLDTYWADELRRSARPTAPPTLCSSLTRTPRNHGGIDRQTTGPSSDTVRLELQADCFAGAWVGAASTIKNDDGVVFLDPVTEAQISDALNATAVIGDDRIQQATQGQVNPKSWIHGSREKGQQWFMTGLDAVARGW